MGHEYVTVNGITVKLRPISAVIRDALAGKYNPPKPPTYEVKNVTGEVQLYPHDKTTLETDEDKAAWKEYEEATIDANIAFNKRILRTYILFGTNYAELYPSDESWMVAQQEMGIDIPTDEKDRKVHYMITEVLSSDIDARNMIESIRFLSTIGRMTAVKEAEESFRNKVEVGKETDGGRSDRDSVEAAK